MLEEGLTHIDEAERLRLQATVDRHRMDERHMQTRKHQPPGGPDRARPTRTPARAVTPA